MKKQRLTAMMVIYNEADRYLSRVLNHLSLWVDEIFILDDGSTDNTGEICSNYNKAFLLENKEHSFNRHEALLRKKLWEIVTERNPDWILAIDADEIFADRIITEIDSYLRQKTYDCFAFRLFDFWKSVEFYRIDGSWNPWNRFSPLLVRYNPTIKASWPDLVIHCGRLPLEYRNLPNTFQSDIRIKHFGWARAEDHYQKYLFYREKDIEQYQEIQPHTESIMDPFYNIKLEKWFERKW